MTQSPPPPGRQKGAWLEPSLGIGHSHFGQSSGGFFSIPLSSNRKSKGANTFPLQFLSQKCQEAKGAVHQIFKWTLFTLFPELEILSSSSVISPLQPEAIWPRQPFQPLHFSPQS